MIFPVLVWLTLNSCGVENGIDEKGSRLTIEKQNVFEDTFTHQQKAWKSKEGMWIFDNNTVTQKATDRYFPLLLLQGKPYINLDVSVDFMPISGRIDASGGVVFRAVDAKNYYIVRANALEDNFRLYYFKNGSRYEISSATVTPPSFKQYSTIRVVAKGDHIQAYLNGTLCIDHHDNTFSQGYVGLWTKADSVTTFDNFKVSGALSSSH